MPEPVVSVTFDNLGEAAQLELGMWPPEVPEGQHFTVVDVLPRLLELLSALSGGRCRRPYGWRKAGRSSFVVILALHQLDPYAQRTHICKTGKTTR